MNNFCDLFAVFVSVFFIYLMAYYSIILIKRIIMVILNSRRINKKKIFFKEDMEISITILIHGVVISLMFTFFYSVGQRFI